MLIKKGVRKGEELKAPRYASAAVIRNYITICNIIPNTYINKEKCYNIIGKIAKRDNDGNITDK